MTYTADLSGAELNYWVARAQNLESPEIRHISCGSICRYIQPHNHDLKDYISWTLYAPHEDWNQGGPIIEQECIMTAPDGEGGWTAAVCDDSENPLVGMSGATLLIAAMRAYVFSVYGETVPQN